jgi:hypothetical protein
LGNVTVVVDTVIKGLVTVTPILVVRLWPPRLYVTIMEALPWATAVINPPVPAVATAEFEEE